MDSRLEGTVMPVNIKIGSLVRFSHEAHSRYMGKPALVLEIEILDSEDLASYERWRDVKVLCEEEIFWVSVRYLKEIE